MATYDRLWTALHAESCYRLLESRYGPTMTTAELAHELGLATKTLRNRAGNLPVPSFVVGGRRRFRTERVAALIDRGGEL